jgi:serine/threonine protein phosphatase PrpC
LPEHPVHAGATAIVAVLTGKILTVANAGDSRAVLCRAGGAVFPLSYDHKPQQDREMTRITRSGGFVNNFGRINGNLNLSRSIGDLKYKQVPGIPPADQMITAEPDIMQVGLQEDDEFIVLGCDGIWDCLSNEDAVEYVRQRIDTRTPTEIGSEMLDQIISTDPRISQGIGGDNMTIMIVDLQPELRSCRKSVPDTAEP